jgi:hypothetical protein
MDTAYPSEKPVNIYQIRRYSLLEENNLKTG